MRSRMCGLMAMLLKSKCCSVRVKEVRSFSPSPQRSHWTPRPDGRYRKRDSDEPRTDLLGMDGCALYCVFWIIINGFIGTMLFFTIHARDRDFFKPVTQDPTGFFFGRQ
eukprot:TRINITY_DN11132_c0_g1_i3.p1 TRINITY_DN11132_c0_g1~~TRINITY_DN11132_c0_g1_i3.p1  ORF type:complete len:109 (-),score=14.45 TRINITY_DN11132_c0_g1_i3:291-617(-)